MTTSEPQSNGGGESQDPEWTLFAADSRASQSPSPAAGRRRRTLVGSGPRSQRSFASYDPATSSWRTFQGSLLEEWATYSETWPRAGTTRNGTAYQRRSSVPPIYADESSLWPTPKGSAAHYGRPRENDRGDLQAAALMFPTPVADDTGHRQESYTQGGTALSTVAGGQLNPTWVEWLMGFPPGWTDLEPSETP
jgi:hypothetical protein